MMPPASGSSPAALFRHAVLAAQRAGSRHLAERLKPHGLTPAWAEVLSVLRDHGPLTIRELGRLLVCESDHPSRLVARMEQTGWVERRPCDHDRRAREVRLTAKGRHGAATVANLEETWDAELARVLGPREMARVTRALLRTIRRSDAALALETRFPNADTLES